jgi:hypothetical protein
MMRVKMFMIGLRKHNSNGGEVLKKLLSKRATHKK